MKLAYDDAIQQLKTHLKDYMLSQGISINQNNSFKCPNKQGHKHGDRTPSGYLYDKDIPRWQCLKCVDSKELIWTDKGLIPLSEIRKGSKVLGLDGKLKNVIEIYKNKKDNMVAISLASFINDPLIVSSDHPILALRKEEILKLPYIYRGKDRLSGVKIKAAYRKPKKQGKIKLIKYENIAAENLQPGDYMLFPLTSKEKVVNTIESTIPLSNRKGTRGRVRVNSLPINKDTAWLIGMYLSEGSYTGRALSFSLHKNELETYGKRIIEIVKQYIGIESTIDNITESNCTVIRVSSVDLGNLFSSKFGKLSHGKYLPTEVFSWEDSSKLALLNGWSNGDGTKSKGDTNGITVSNKLAYGMFRLSVDLKLSPTLSKRKEYIGKDGIQRKASWRIDTKHEAARSFYEKIEGTEYYIQQITKLDKLKESRDTIDITVEDKPYFTTKNSLVHNCNINGDIFDLAAFVHDVPTEGAGFKYETIPHVIEAIGSNIEIDYTEEDIPEYILLAGKTKDIFKANPANPINLTNGTYGPKRAYPENIAKQIVEMFHLAELPSPVYDHPVFKATTFPGAKPLLIPITKNGFYLGAVARHREVDVINLQAPKYQNSEKTDLTNYPSIINYDKALNAARKSGRLNIFEGVFNSLLAVVSGMSNTIGILGVNSKLSDLEELIQHSGVREIVFYLDKDSSGVNRAIELGQTFHKLGYLTLFYKYDPNGLDYDEEFVQKGEAFTSEISKELNMLSLVEFILFSKGSFLSNEEISKVTKYEMIMEIIAEYGSMVSAKNYAEAVVNYYKNPEGESSLNFDDVFPRIRQSLSDKKSPLLTRINDITDAHAGLIKKAPTIEEKISIINTFSETVNKSSDNVSIGLKATAKRRFEKMVIEQETTGARMYKSGYDNIDNPASEEERLVFMQEALAGILGKPSHGKSLFVRGFALHQAITNPDVLVMYFSTDDSAARTLAWVTASIAKVSFDQVIKPYKERDRYAKDHIQEAQDIIRRITGETFLLYDKNEAGSTIDMIRTINDAVREYPQKRIISITDNLFNSNDISMITSEGSKRYAIDAAIEQWKQVTMQKVDLHFNTLEVKKNINGRLTDSDIKETGSINFRNDYTLSLFNSHKEWRQDSRMVTMQSGVSVPIIEVTVLKNKTGGAGQTHFFHLNGPCGILEPVLDEATILHYRTLMANDRGPGRQSGGGQRPNSGYRGSTSMF